MFDVSDGLTQERRGPRPGGVDTRAALLDAAREVFVEHGYEGATMRAIAARANVDAAMVNHWFGSKEGLFAEAVIDVPFDLDGLVRRLLDGDVGTLGERPRANKSIVARQYAAHKHRQNNAPSPALRADVVDGAWPSRAGWEATSR
jgi:AcrR family transcriptional regulator